MSGWIKLHRELCDKAIWTESTPEQKVILITLLMMANHEEKEWEWKGEKFKAKPGQIVTSLPSIQEKCGKGVSIQNIRTALKRFKSNGFLTDESTNKNRLITIVNWGFYQNEDYESTGKQTGNQQATNRQLTANKNDKKLINNKYIADSDEFGQRFESFWKKYPKKQGKSKAMQKMASYHKQGLNWDEVMNGLNAYIAYVEKERSRGFNRQYMDGSTFVNGRRWEDDWTPDETPAEVIPYKPTFRKMAPIPLVRATDEDNKILERIYRQRGII